MEVVPADFEANFKKIAEIAKRARESGAELAVFPEMFVCGFNYKKNLEYLRENGDKAERTIAEIAKESGIAICGTLPHLCDGGEMPRNRMVLVDENGGEIAHYDKIHLFPPMKEDRHVCAGDEIVVADTKWGKLGLAICYDLRFPEMFAEMKARGAETFIVSAAFPHPRSDDWRTLIRARAAENNCPMVAVNRIGTESFGRTSAEYCGMSAIISNNGTIFYICD